MATTTAPAARRPAASTARSPGRTGGTRLLEILRPYLPAILHLLLSVEVLLYRRIVTNRAPGIRLPLLPLIGRLITLVNIPLPVREHITAGSCDTTGSSARRAYRSSGSAYAGSSDTRTIVIAVVIPGKHPAATGIDIRVKAR